ncbi:MAG: hypothetical protein RL660_1910, partial [Bacteroidota bacterium]
MSLKKIILSVVAICASIVITAQQPAKKLLDMREATSGLFTNLAPLNLKQLQWQNANTYVFTAGKDSNECLVRNILPAATPDTFLRLSQINAALLNSGDVALKSMPAINWLSATDAYFSKGSKYYQMRIAKDGSVTTSLMYTLPDDAENISIHPKTLSAAYTSNYNLFICTIGNPAQQLTTDGNANLLYGTSVHRDEFGIDHGIFWHDNGRNIAFYQMDQSMVTDYPIINWQTIPATVNNIKYPFAGATSHNVSLYTYNLDRATKARINTTEKSEQYLTCVTWHPTDEKIYIGILNREQTQLSLNKYNAKTGAYDRT